MPPAAHTDSLILVNTGEGKGKTTAAMGTMLRAVARGWKVTVIQFLKSEKWKVGEEKVARDLGVSWWTAGDGFTWDSEDMDETRALAVAAWDAAQRSIGSGDFDMVILDEITYPMSWGWISTDAVVETLLRRPSHVNVIATGRDAPQPLLDVADTATEMVKIHHAFDRGIKARKGIDL